MCHTLCRQGLEKPPRGGGFERFFAIFTPKNWGFMIEFDEHIFSDGWFNHQLAPCWAVFGWILAGQEAPSRSGWAQRQCTAESSEPSRLDQTFTHLKFFQRVEWKPLKFVIKRAPKPGTSSPIHFSGVNSLLNFGGCTSLIELLFNHILLAGLRAGPATTSTIFLILLRFRVSSGNFFCRGHCVGLEKNRADGHDKGVVMGHIPPAVKPKVVPKTCVCVDDLT